MSIIQFKTVDKNLSFIIKKNPSTGMQLKTIRQGTAFGWYSQNNTAYNICFKDADTAVSFGNQEFEYLNTDRYNSPLCILNIISEFFSSTVKEQIDLDNDGIEKIFLINMIHIKSISQVQNFEKYFPDFKITYDPYVSNSYKVIITTTKNCHIFFNYINLLMMFIALTNNDYIQMDAGTIEKYLNSIERLDAPFFIRYLFSRNVLHNKKQFDQYKERLETTKLYDSINFEYGNTSNQRRNTIKKYISFDKSIVDIGCGEGFYAIPFAKNLSPDKTYFAIDIVPELTTSVMNQAKKHEINNIEIFNNIDEFIDIYIEIYNDEKVDVILTEVIEHMPKNQSILLIQKILDDINFDKIIITVPNIEFNQFYMLNEEFRHYDHVWEPTQDEFQQWLRTELSEKYTLNFIQIGDKVNGISTSIGCIIT